MTRIVVHGIMIMRLGVAQLVARDVWDVEVAGSSPVTQTIFITGIGAVVARTPGGREVASSTLVSQTINKISGCGAVGSAQRSGR